MPPKKNKKGQASKDSRAESQSGSSQESRSQASSQSSLSQSSLTSAPPASAGPQPDQRGGGRGRGRGRGQGPGPQVGQTGPPPSAAAFPQLSAQSSDGADQRRDNFDQRGGGRGRGRGQGRGQGRGGGQEKSDRDQGAGDPFPSLQQPAAPASVWGKKQTQQGSSQVPLAQEPKERAEPPQVTQSAQKQQAPKQMVQQQPIPESRTDPASHPPQAATKTVVAKPAPQQSSDVGKVAERLSLMDISGIPKRKNPLKAGTEGRPIQVLTNMLAINFEKKFCSNVIHYDLAIEPTCPKYLMRPAFNEAKKKIIP
jgi:hypothetical protein